MNEENRLIIEQLNKFGRVPQTSELLKMIEDLEKEKTMYKTSFEEMSKNYFELQNNWNELKSWLEEKGQKYKNEEEKAYPYFYVWKQMQGFEGSTRLLQIADDIEEMKTICICGSKATQNIRKVNGQTVFDGDQVVIDNSSQVEYESVCGNCYLKLNKKMLQNTLHNNV